MAVTIVLWHNNYIVSNKNQFMENEIIQAARSAIKTRSTSGSVSDFTKNAQAIAKDWIKKCCWKYGWILQ